MGCNTTYQHQWLDGSTIDLPVGKAVCVGRNYADHAKELNNPVPSEPILFIKPTTGIVPLSPQFAIPAQQGECHHEAEIALLIGAPLSKADVAEVIDAIVGVGVALDLTLRDLQSTLKEKGHPWERAKAFDGSCPLSPFVPMAEFADLKAVDIALTVNGDVRQQGNSSAMLFPMIELVAHISHWFTLQPGDVVLTGTPAGVAALQSGDELELRLAERWAFASTVTAR